MSNHFSEIKRDYRMALCQLTDEQRLEIEHELLAELKQRVIQAEINFDKLGGQSRMDSIVMCLAEMDNGNG